MFDPRQLRFLYWSDAPAVFALAAWMLLIGFAAVLGVFWLICPVSAAWGDRAVGGGA